MKREACRVNEQSQEIVRNVTERDYTLKDLKPYTKYLITIQAYNGLLSDIYRKEYITPQSGKKKKLISLLEFCFR